MALDTSNASEEKENIDINGTTAVQVIAKNVSTIFTKVGAGVRYVLGPNEEHTVEYDDADADPLENAVQFIDADGNPVVTIPDTHQTFEFERLACVPEYDAESEVPQVRSDDSRYSTPYNPRAIVRFTAASSFTAGLYSYSATEGAWVRIDKP